MTPSPDDFLHQSLTKIAPITERGRRVVGIGTSYEQVVVLATALVVRAEQHAIAGRTLLRTSNPHGAAPNLRALYEAFGELAFLADATDREFEAAVAFAFASREIERVLLAQGAAKDDLEALRKRREEQRAANPAAYAAAESRSNYWIVTGRKELVERAVSKWPTSDTTSLDGFGRHIYKLMSWDSHHVLAAISCVDLRQESPTFGTVQPDHQWTDFQSVGTYLAGMALLGMRELYDMIVARAP